MSDIVPVKVPSYASMYAIDKLVPTNFSAWKFRVTFVLKDRGLWEYVDPVTAEEATRRNPTGNVQALSQIVLTLSDAQIALVRRETSAARAWTAICNHFEQRGLAQRVHLRRKLFNIKYEEGATMQAHLNSIRDLVDQLEAIEFGVQDADLAIIVLCSLPSRYDGLVIQLESMPADHLTFAIVSARLLSEFDRQADNEDKGHNDRGTALTAAAGPRVKGPPCTFCGRTGHTENGPGRRCWDKHGRPPLPSRQPRESNIPADSANSAGPIEFGW
jgi:hypothetical protein